MHMIFVFVWVNVAAWMACDAHHQLKHPETAPKGLEETCSWCPRDINGDKYIPAGTKDMAPMGWGCQ